MRTDTHRPSAIDPSEYTALGGYYGGNSDDMYDAYKQDMDYLVSLGVPEEELKQTKCDHCGQRFAHGVLYVHLPSDEYVHIGHICAAETMSLPDRISLQRKRAEDRAKAARERREAWEGQTDETREAVAFWSERDLPRNGYGEFLTDLIAKTRRYVLTERQAAALAKSVRTQRERDAKAQEHEAKRKPATPLAELPNERTVITGKVVAVKYYEWQWGGFEAATIVVDNGKTEYKAWVKVTSKFRPERDETVTVKATFEAKEDGFVKGTRAIGQ